MALPSQHARLSAAGGMSMYRRRRRRRRPSPQVLATGGVLLIGALLAVALFLIIRSIDGGGAGAGATSDGEPTSPAAQPAAEPQPEAADPVVIDQRPRENRPPPRTPERLAAATTEPAEPAQPEADDPANTAEPDSGPSLLTSALRTERRTSEPKPEPAPESSRPDRPASIAQRALSAADRLIADGDPLAARALLDGALRDAALDPMDRQVLRAKLSELNNRLVFGPDTVEADPLTETYEVEPGDSLSRIAAKRGLDTNWRLIKRVNRLDNANRIRVGQELKLVRGPFHAVVDKSEYRLDLFHGPPDNDDAWMFVRSFDVGLGEDDSTPTGRFVVRENGKLQNPGWVNPRDPSERYEPDDPQNPVGEYWIGIDGLGEDAVYTGYGLHGTIEPATIGQQRSMGCVRLLPDDIALLYETLAGGVSRVRITE